MTAFEALSVQRDELLQCVSRREKLLRSLYGASLAFLALRGGRCPSPEAVESGLAAFLDSNDINRDRFFQPETLPTRLLQDASLERTHEPASTDLLKPASPTHSSGTLAHNIAASQLDHLNSVVEKDSRSALPIIATSLQQGIAHNGVDAKSHGDRASEAGEPQLETHNVPQTAGASGSAIQHLASSPQSIQMPSGFMIAGTAKTNPLDVVGTRTSQHTAMSSAATESETSVRQNSVQLTSPSKIPHISHTSRPSSSAGADLPSRYMQDVEGDTDIGLISMPPLGDPLSAQLPGPSQDNDKGAASKPGDVPGTVGDISVIDPGQSNSRKPMMRIDTSRSISSTNNEGKTASGPPTGITPNRSVPTTATMAHTPPERMTTRVSSGVLRHKSVSEILGETPKTTSIDKDSLDGAKVSLTKVSKSFATADTEPAMFKVRPDGVKDHERNRIPAVVFERTQFLQGIRSTDHVTHQIVSDDERSMEFRDYFLTMFAAQASSPPRAVHLGALLKTANKTLQTDDYFIEVKERQDYKILSHVRDKQQQGRWSLRQPARAPEPKRLTVHWDILLGQMKWMRTDYHEERKFKLSGARFLAEACSLWVVSNLTTRLSLQVKVREKSTHKQSVSSSTTPELMSDERSDTAEDDSVHGEACVKNVSAAIFSLAPEVFVFGLQQNAVNKEILSDLPCYDPSKNAREGTKPLDDYDPDEAWKLPIVSVSKFVQGKLIAREEPLPKKARLELSQEDSTFDHETPASHMILSEDEVALFNSEHKHIRDRIHAAHAFKPPTEFMMPPKDFYEFRPPSQWTLNEDDVLRKSVREYSYNWSLISSCLSSPSPFYSGAERRTPWECFERWINLEGLPAEMSKLSYFRTYHTRLQQATRAYEARQVALAQQHGQNPAQLPARRRSNQPYNVEKRKNTRPLHLIDAIRKHAKRKEAAAHKQAQAAHMAEMRKKNESNNEKLKERRQAATPSEWSRLKYERQVKAEEQQKVYRLQVAAQNQARKVQHQLMQQQGVPANAQPRAHSGPPSGASPDPARALPAGRAALDAARLGSQLASRPVNGLPLAQPVGTAQMQAPMQPGRAVHPPMSSDMRLLQEAQRVQAQQQAYLQQRQQQLPINAQNGVGNSPNMQSIPAFPQNNVSMYSAHSGRGGQAVSGNTNSPRMGQQTQPVGGNVTPAISQLQAQMKLRHPGASLAEISRLTTEQLYRMSQQSAMTAAAGNTAATPHPQLQGQGLGNPQIQQTNTSSAQAQRPSSAQSQSPTHFQQRPQQQQVQQKQANNQTPQQRRPPAPGTPIIPTPQNPSPNPSAPPNKTDTPNTAYTAPNANTNGSNPNGVFNHQQYAHYMRTQQATQQQRHTSSTSPPTSSAASGAGSGTSTVVKKPPSSGNAAPTVNTKSPAQPAASKSTSSAVHKSTVKG